MLENQKRAEDIAKAAIWGREIHQPDKEPTSTKPKLAESVRRVRAAKARMDEVERTRKRAEELNELGKALSETDPKVQESKPMEWPAPGSLYNAMRAVGEVGYRMALALSPAPETAEPEAETPQIQTPPDTVRSPAMERFFEDVRRFRGHFAWLWEALSGWTVVLLIAGLAWGGGFGVMQFDQYQLAIGFFVAAFGVLVIKAIASTKDRERTYLIVGMAILFLALHVAWVIYTHRQIVGKAQ